MCGGAAQNAWDMRGLISSFDIMLRLSVGIRFLPAESSVNATPGIAIEFRK
jgi:hypothetical protein